MAAMAADLESAPLALAPPSPAAVAGPNVVKESQLIVAATSISLMLLTTAVVVGLESLRWPLSRSGMPHKHELSTVFFEPGMQQEQPNCEDGSCRHICRSLIYSAEVGNIRPWLLPQWCESTLQSYVNSEQYDWDLATAIFLAKKQLAQQPTGDRVNGLVVLDIDETALSNLPYYKRHHYGVTGFDVPAWNDWVQRGEAPAIAPTLALYNELLAKNWSIAFITGREESQRESTAANLRQAGYSGWTELFLRSDDELGLGAVAYKSRCRAKLEEQGYAIVANFGDQWTDLEGYAVGTFSYKLPNPFYYVG